MSTAKREPCEILEWDSNFFGFRIARVRGDSLTQELVREIDAWCREEQVRCLYFLSRVDDPETTRLAEDNGFRSVDIRVTMCFKASGESCSTRSHQKAAATIRLACSEDLPALKRLAGDIFHNTRFYFDQNFPRQLCDSLYDTWIERSCQGYADAVLVADMDGLPVGFCTCHLDDKTGVGKIGITAVDRNYHGRGIGTQLLCGSVDWLLDRGVTGVLIVTQGRNVVTLRLYQRCGFLIHDVQIWYHKWFDV